MGMTISKFAATIFRQHSLFSDTFFCLHGIYDSEYHSAAMDVSPDGPVSHCLEAGVQRQRRYYDSAPSENLRCLFCTVSPPGDQNNTNLTSGC